MPEAASTSTRRSGGFAVLSLLAAGLLASAPALGARIYTCIDSNGKRLTSDRPIPECAAREQRLLNSDGSVRKIVPPTPTADERAQQEAREREEMSLRASRQDAIRRDRNLMLRFPNEQTHDKARAAALDDVRNAVQLSRRRLEVLASERKPLTAETEFYVGKPLPHKLKQQLDANDAATEAQQTLIQNQQAEIGRINALFDVELERLRKLWAGAPPGSMGALPAPASPGPGAASQPVRKAASK